MMTDAAEKQGNTLAGRTRFKGFLKPSSNAISSPHSYELSTKIEGHVFADNKKEKAIQGAFAQAHRFLYMC